MGRSGGSLCEECGLITVRKLVEQAKVKICSYDKYKTLSSRGSHIDCSLCKSVQQLMSPLLDRNRDRRLDRKLNHKLNSSSDKWDNVYLAWAPGQAQLHCFVDDDDKDSHIGVLPALAISTHPGDPYESMFFCRDIADTAASDQCMALARKWFRACVDLHDASPDRRCTPRPGYLPTRLLELTPRESLDQTDRVYLRETVDLDIRYQGYAALSYCWGTASFTTLTRDNLDVLKRGIAVEDLPQTVRDAVIVARDLGIRFLWVDAYCIIQVGGGGDNADWERESKEMLNIYSRALLTIVAASAKSADEGFLQRERPLSGSDGARIPVERASDGTGHGTARIANESYQSDFKIEDPIRRRAWTMQEELLSTRVLYFGSQELVYSCPTRTYMESFVDTDPDARDVCRRSDPCQRFEFDSARSHLGTLEWARVVEEYTSRDLTFYADRYSAILGLEQRFQLTTGKTFFYGICSEFAWTQLLWKPVRKKDSDKEHMTRVSSGPPLAPSWSWISCPGRISCSEWRTGSAMWIPSLSLLPDPSSITTRWNLGLIAPLKFIPVFALKVGERPSSLVLTRSADRPDDRELWEYDIEELSLGLRVHLDNVDGIPQRHFNHKDNDQLINVYFLGLRQSRNFRSGGDGLVLIPLQTDKSARRFIRIGVFQNLDLGILDHDPTLSDNLTNTKQTWSSWLRAGFNPEHVDVK